MSGPIADRGTLLPWQEDFLRRIGERRAVDLGFHGPAMTRYAETFVNTFRIVIRAHRKETEPGAATPGS